MKVHRPISSKLRLNYYILMCTIKLLKDFLVDARSLFLKLFCSLTSLSPVLIPLESGKQNPPRWSQWAVHAVMSDEEMSSVMTEHRNNPGARQQSLFLGPLTPQKQGSHRSNVDYCMCACFFICAHSNMIIRFS